ncbi:MAG: murein L,D-transpeptidase [Hyphomicrobium sp.]
MTQTFLRTTLVASASRMALFGLCTMAVCALATSQPARAQDNWWDSMTGGGPFGSTPKQADDRPEKTVEALDDLRPDATPWRSDIMLDAMSGAIARYEQIVASGGWPAVPPGRMMRVNDDDPRVPILRKRLRISGDMPAKGQYYDSQTFDSELELGVKRFQSRHGIRPSGRIERSVYEVLNITADQRLAQLKLNYDRIKALMSGIEDRYVLVNVPAFQLEAVEKHEVQLRHRVIVGRPGRDTPDVRAMVKALNFFPFWRVPDSVATLDLIPRLQKEPEYLVNEGIRVFDGYNGPEVERSTIDWYSPNVANYRFKQDPGDKNALGLVRLDMQNEHGVYMHDTPLKKLFDQRSRPFSAGCVRVQDVFQLADWLARYEPGWEQAGQAQQVVAGGQPLDLTLSRPVPVHFVYVTAWNEPSTDKVQFRPDIYGRDGLAMHGAAVAEGEDAPPPIATQALAP